MTIGNGELSWEWALHPVVWCWGLNVLGSFVQSLEAERAVNSRFRSLAKPAAFLAGFFVCFLVAREYRLSSNLHFAQMHVRITTGSGAEGADSKSHLVSPEVLLRLEGSEGRRLEPVEGSAVDWRSNRYSGPVQSVLIAAREPFALRPEQIQLRFGDYWSQPDWIRTGSDLLLAAPEEKILRGLAGKGLTNVLEVRLIDPPDSFQLRAKSALNWQGDMSLLLLCLVQGAVVYLIGLQILRRAFSISASSDAVRWEGDSAIFVASSMTQALLLLLLGSQFVFYIRVSVGQHSASQAGIGLLLILMLIISGTRLIQGLMAKRSGIQLVLGGVLLVLLMTAGVWFLREPLDLRPGEEAVRCVEVGERLAAQGWRGLSQLSQAVSTEEVRKSLVFSLPAVGLLGPGVSSVQLAGLLLQACNGLLFFWLVARFTGLQGAVAGLLLLVVVEPEFRLLGASASPKIMELFCVLLVWGSFELGRVWLRRIGKAEGDFPTILWLLACMLFGAVLAFADLATSRGILAGVAVIPAVILLWALSDRESGTVRRSSVTPPAVSAGILVAVGLCWMISSGVDRQIRNYLPTSLRVDVDEDAERTGVESGTEGAGRYVSIWRDEYFPLLPEDDRQEFIGRKLLHERLAAGSGVFGTMLRKAIVFARSDRTFDMDLDRPLLPYPVFRAVLGYGLSGWIILLAAVRFWNADGVGFSKAEVFPACFVMMVLAERLLVGEARPEDSLNWLMPLCWSAGAVLGRRPQRACDGESRFVGIPQHVLPGAALLSAAILLHTAFGLVVDRSGLTFARITPVTAEDVKPKIKPASEVTRVSFTVRFPRSVTRLRPGDKVSDEVRLLCERSELSSLRFFLSGGQRQTRTTQMKWAGVPVKYQVYFNDILVKSGPLSDLEHPQYCDMKSGVWTRPGEGIGNFVYVRLALQCTGEANLGVLNVRPAVSLEYPWPGR